ncbi:MAG: GDYXXLXY domain-containing protein [Sphingomonadales bacterium]|nr:GDYXXLXY domain-containing protein [Sphingomonadales bacterium]
MNRALHFAAALAIPLLGLGGMWLSADRLSRQGTEWDVPIQGYDPRDLLQGHYVQFQYEWPERLPDGAHGPDLSYQRICVFGSSPKVEGAGVDLGDRCRNFVRAGEAEQGRLYTSQAEARRLQEKLWDQKLQGVVRIRLRPDGHITPLRITFRQRPPDASASPAP